MPNLWGLVAVREIKARYPINKGYSQVHPHTRIQCGPGSGELDCHGPQQRRYHPHADGR
jgi:hypothetical protein